MFDPEPVEGEFWNARKIFYARAINKLNSDSCIFSQTLIQ